MTTVFAAFLISIFGTADPDSQSVFLEFFNQTFNVVETLVDQVNPLLLVENGDGSGG